MAETELELGGKQYRLSKLNAFQQFHISRRIAKLIPPLIPIFMQIARESKAKGGGAPEILNHPEVLQPFADALADLSDEDAEYVLNTCLSAVRRHESGTWAPIWIPSAKRSMMDDLNDLSKLLPIAVRVIQDSLGPFIEGLLTSRQSVAAEETGAA